MTVLERLRGGLIVSVQARAESVLNTPATIALLALCAERNGAAAVRIEGAARIAAVRGAVAIPIVGLIKGASDGDLPYITTTPAEVDAIAAAGADAVAFDATTRVRGATVGDLIDVIRRCGRIAFADCSDVKDGAGAAAAGADVVSTTLAGYTAATRGRPLPALDLIAALARLHPFVVCEGGIAGVDDARNARAAGASAICVGTAITNVDALVERFARAARGE